ncbi:trypsin-like serine protease [Spirulina major CS-329]|uniref:trypsin-like serine protease n=1 Tax=Spirulina TaxID=1154 RepID=UPI00233078DC|nr:MULTISPECIES: trypsin-like serine protease [Spirulina]MDB9496148.1 trypsin-like serine protease [Spirulina subsalsa CS-330]MDB9502766.1 trypsin-like serine protease [Spirulina major CS-329]
MLELLALSVFFNPEAPPSPYHIDPGQGYDGGVLSDSIFLNSDAPPSPYHVDPGQGYDGVVLLNIDGEATVCTGALLDSGRHILTAASCFETQAPGIPSTTAEGDRVTVTFDLPRGTVERKAAAVHIHPRWDNSPQRNHNLAIIELSNLAPAQADRYAIYRSSFPGVDEINRTFTRIGYGIAGNGVQGEVSGSIIQRKLIGGNRYDAFGDLLNTPPDGGEVNPSTANAIAPNTQLLYDFDGFSRSRDALGREYQRYDLGLLRHDVTPSSLDDPLLQVRPPLPDPPASNADNPPNAPQLPPAQLAQLQNPSLPIGLPWESGTTQGDEGSPAFIDGKIAGIASQRLRPQTEGIDITDALDGSVGEYFLDTRVSAYADFIDEILGKSQ